MNVTTNNMNNEVQKNINERCYAIAIFEQVQNDLQVFFKKNLIKGINTKVKNVAWKLVSLLNYYILKKTGFLLLNEALFEEAIQDFSYYVWEKMDSIKLLNIIINKPGSVDKVFDLFEEVHSRMIFEWILKRKISFALIGIYSSNIYPYSMIKNLSNNQFSNKKIKESKKNNFLLQEVDGFKFMHPLKSANPFEDTWIKEQYFLNRVFDPKEGDVIISAGAYLGETSIWFADRTKKKGVIYAFEPSEYNFEGLKRNIALNNLEKVIYPINLGLWHETTNVNFLFKEVGSEINEIDGSTLINTIKLDDFIEKYELERIDYIKMDVEGAELNALKGAERALVKFKPKLAISVYHSSMDIIEIPLYLKSIVPDYKFYLSQKTEALRETILFVSCDNKEEYVHE